MNCQTPIQSNIIGSPLVCGHSITQHAGDESGMGANEYCMVPDCPCLDFTRETKKCPSCTSPRKAEMPAVQHEGEISICYDPWHYEGLERCPVCHSRIRQPAGNCAHTWHMSDAELEALRAKLRRELCDGNHAMPECEDPQCWQLEEDPPTVVPKLDTSGEYHEDDAAERRGKTIQKWADQAMFTAEPIDAQAGPRVYLLSMTPDPLAAIAAACKMYKGEVARSYRDVTHAERQEFVQQVLRTKLQAPFEFVKFHFMIEGVTRAFTHQMVRQRTAVYAQESLRFAVKEDMPVGLPPSLAGTTGELSAWHTQENYDRASETERDRYMWDQGIAKMKATYDALIANGMPAEDARGLLPHNTLTRLHYSTDLRALLDHAGNRLCTQAQFEWRLVFARIAEAIRKYQPYDGLLRMAYNMADAHARNFLMHCEEADRWQYELLADLFRPVCYATGKCEFMANFDRPCSIRNRVQANHERGRTPEEWGEELDLVEDNPIITGVGPQSVVRNKAGHPVFIGAIRSAEWLLNPDAAR